MVEYIVAIDVTRVRFPADASLVLCAICEAPWPNVFVESIDATNMALVLPPPDASIVRHLCGPRPNR